MFPSYTLILSQPGLTVAGLPTSVLSAPLAESPLCSFADALLALSTETTITPWSVAASVDPEDEQEEEEQDEDDEEEYEEEEDSDDDAAYDDEEGDEDDEEGNEEEADEEEDDDAAA